MFALLIEGSNGALSIWETYIYNSTTPHAGGDKIEIFSGYTAQTFNQTSGMTEECCKTINSLLNDTGRFGMGLGRSYNWDNTTNQCRWVALEEMEGDCVYCGENIVNNYCDSGGTCSNSACTPQQITTCITPLDYLDQTPAEIKVKQVFDELVLKNLIDAKSRQTISAYPLLQLFYELYLNAGDCGNSLSGKLTYTNLFQYMDKIGDYWLDLIEQVVPATTIWEGCEPSGKIYRNTIFDQNKYEYRKYSLNWLDVPTQCSGVSGVTNESIGEALVDVKVIEDCQGGDCLGDDYKDCQHKIKVLDKRIKIIQDRIDFIDMQLNAGQSQDGATGIDCNYSPSQLQDLQLERTLLDNQIQDLLNEKANVNQECAQLNSDIMTANALYYTATQSCLSISTRITKAQNVLSELIPNTVQYEKQRNYLSILENEYERCIAKSNFNVSNYNRVYITQIYNSNEYEGNVYVIGDDEWDSYVTSDGEHIQGPFYNTELIHNCDNGVTG